MTYEEILKQLHVIKKSSEKVKDFETATETLILILDLEKNGINE